MMRLIAIRVTKVLMKLEGASVTVADTPVEIFIFIK